MIRIVLIVVHLGVAASWWGSMLYSLTVVQPKITRFFADEQRREEFLLALAHGNRWRVVALATVLILTGLSVAIVGPRHMAVGYACAVVLYAAATLIFAYVSWWHWPARAFALPAQLAGFRQRLRRLAMTMTGLVGTAFVLALTVSVA